MVDPVSLRDPAACEGMEAALDAATAPDVPGRTRLLSAVARVDGRSIVRVSVYRFESQQASLLPFARDVMAKTREKIALSSTIIEDGTTNPAWVRVGSDSGVRGFVRMSAGSDDGGKYAPSTQAFTFFGGGIASISSAPAT